MPPLAVTFHVSPMYSAASGGHKVLRHAPASGIKRTFDKGGVGIHLVLNLLLRRPRLKDDSIFQKQSFRTKQTNSLQIPLYPAAEKYLSFIPHLQGRLFPLIRVLPT